MRMRLIIYLVILVIISNFTYAGIDIILNAYDEASHKARLQLYNDGETVYHNVNLDITNLKTDITYNQGKVVDILKPSSSAIIFQNLQPGTNHLIITTDEGIFEQDIATFKKSVPPVVGVDSDGNVRPITRTQKEANKERVDEIEREREIKEKVIEQMAEERRQLAKEETEGKNIVPYIILSVILVVFIIIIWFIWYKISGRGNMQ